MQKHIVEISVQTEGRVSKKALKVALETWFNSDNASVSDVAISKVRVRKIDAD